MEVRLSAWRDRAWAVLALPGAVGGAVLDRVAVIGKGVAFLGRSLVAIGRRPFRFAETLEHIRFYGNRSVPLILLTSAFTGMVLALQAHTALARLGSERFIGPVVALGLIRELGPVMAALMITARAGSATAAVLGNMRVTDQVEALEAMAVDPVHYLVGPRLLAALVAVPLVTSFFIVFGIGSAYAFGTRILSLDGGTFLSGIRQAVEWSDLASGFEKSLVFGALIAWIATWRGYTATGGAAGVGRATAQAVVEISALVLIGDYVMTALMFR